MIDLYELNRLTSFVYTFKHDYNVYTEFVYGYITEILDKDPFGQVTKIEFTQILNLEDFVKGEKTIEVKRVFRTSELQHNLQFRKLTDY